MANSFANGAELPPDLFGGGKETNDFLTNLGFHIIENSDSKGKASARRALGPEAKRHNERCKECKKMIVEMFRQLYDSVETNYRLEVPAKLEQYQGKPYYGDLKRILSALENLRGHKGFIKRKSLPPCDLFIPNPGFVVELDESQHFTSARQTSLSQYPGNLPLAFDINNWKRRCEEIQAIDNAPIYRDEQRA